MVHGGYPELRVDGRPFFIHSAAFHYYRIPRDQWSFLLDRYRHLGINTIDIYIPWNWHEPREGEFDFDGHSNPRRDLRGLLKLISAKGFKLIARPGPEILNEWRHGGYPGWLLERPEYKMDAADILEGRYPPLAGLNTRNAEAAAQGWLDNPVHMKYARIWLEAVARELAPYSASRVFTAPAGGGSVDVPRRMSGPLLFVQLEDDMAIGRTNDAGPAFWRYMEALRSMLRAGGLQVPVFINPTDMRVSATGEGLPDPIGAMGQWYMAPRPAEQASRRELDDEDAAEIEFYVEELKTQPFFPPVVIEYQAGWYCPADDDRPLDSPWQNTLLSSRLLLAHGVHGFSYFPLQDTFTPAGYSVPWANRFYRWDAPLDLNGDPQPRARAVVRNAQFLRTWGAWLAASHKRADFGIVYPLGSYPQNQLTPADILSVSGAVQRLERLGQLAHLSSELLDPEYQPGDQLLRDAIVLMPVFDPSRPEFQMSEKAQQALVEYVRRGGALIVFPSLPSGKFFKQLWQFPVSPANGSSGIFAEQWRFGSGQIIEVTRDFYSRIDLEQNFSESAARRYVLAGVKILKKFLQDAGVRPSIRFARTPELPNDLVATELVSNAGSGLLGKRSGGQGFLSLTNLSYGRIDQNVLALRPTASARAAPGEKPAPGEQEDYILLHVEIPARESLLLPLEQPLCSAPSRFHPCGDSVLAAGAELLAAKRDGKTLELTFYAPTRFAVRMKLAEKPLRVILAQNLPRVHWDAGHDELDMVIPRGASPDFLRVVKMGLRYQPQVPEKARRKNTEAPAYKLQVLNAASLELGETAELDSFPPLVPTPVGSSLSLFLEVQNFSDDQGLTIKARLEGPLHGSVSLFAPPGTPGLARMKVKWPKKSGAAIELSPGPEGFLEENLELRSRSIIRHVPIDFLLVHPGELSHYQFDFDRDGAKEWVLENKDLRAVVSPESGGRVISLVDKDSGFNLISSVGALRDNFSFAENPPVMNPSRARGSYGLFNRPYRASWVEAEGTTGLETRYEAPDAPPAGAVIAKTLFLEGAVRFRADYRVTLKKQTRIPPIRSGAEHPQAFVLENSLPAVLAAGRVTRFCWPQTDPQAPASPPDPKRADKASLHCESFSPGAAPLLLPSDAERLEIRTPGKPGLAIKWKEGQMAIERKDFSVLLKLQFPALIPGGAPGTYSVHFRVLAAE